MTNFTDTYWLEQLDEERREHNQETEGLYKRIADLETENERLRRAGYEIGYHDGAKRIAELDHALTVAVGNWAKADREKRELESLVRDMCQAYECGAGCAMYDECQHWNDDRCPMEERMKELGIEVDE